MAALLPLLLLALLPPPAAPRGPPPIEELLVLTVATEATEGYERFLRSAQRFNYSLRTLGLGQAWRGGDVARTVGGGQKVRWLKRALGELRHRDRLLVAFVDSYDVLFAGGPGELQAKFLRSGAGVVFAAEAFCWPQPELAQSYPAAPPRGKPFLNSGGFVGFAPALWRLVQGWHYPDDADDQLYYSRLYLDRGLREELGLALDHYSQIFQNLNGALDEVVLKLEPGGGRVRNVAYDSLPVVIHGNGPTKLQLNYLGNYVPGGWSPAGGCGDCEWGLRALGGGTAAELPWVLVGVFVERPTPFLQLFLRRLLAWDYPGGRLGLFLHNGEVHHEPHIAALWPQLRQRFSWLRLVGPEEGLQEGAARDMGMSLCRRQPRCQHYLSLDADVALTNNQALKLLLQQNRRVLAPLLSRPGQLWSNFWGALSPEGFYARAQDYIDIVQGKRRGVWNVPHISHAYLVGGATLRGQLKEEQIFSQSESDPDMAFCRHARERGLFLHLTNRQHFGHLLLTTPYDHARPHPDLTQLQHNPQDWEELYLHEDYSRVLQDNLYQQPCPDVYQFPLLSLTFCQQLLEEAEAFGRWSQEHHEEGAESLPLDWLGLEGVWLGALRRFLQPIAAHLYPGYHSKGRAVLSSVIRYLPGPAPTDTPTQSPPTATVSLSLSLSPAMGGGWLFPRYGCSVPAPPPGWVLLHPGRLTHLRRPLAATAARTALLSLLDP